METAAKRNDLKTMFAKQRKLCDYENNKLIDVRPVKSLDGLTLIDGTENIMNRRKEHFSLLLNREIPEEGHLPYTQPLEETFEDLAEDVTIEEIRTAVKQMKNRKAPGIDGIQAEIYKYGGETVIKWLHRVIQACWNSE